MRTCTLCTGGLMQPLLPQCGRAHQEMTLSAQCVHRELSDHGTLSPCCCVPERWQADAAR